MRTGKTGNQTNCSLIFDFPIAQNVGKMMASEPQPGGKVKLTIILLVRHVRGSDNETRSRCCVSSRRAEAHVSPVVHRLHPGGKIVADVADVVPNLEEDVLQPTQCLVVPPVPEVHSVGVASDNVLGEQHDESLQCTKFG